MTQSRYSVIENGTSTHPNISPYTALRIASILDCCVRMSFVSFMDQAIDITSDKVDPINPFLVEYNYCFNQRQVAEATRIIEEKELIKAGNLYDTVGLSNLITDDERKKLRLDYLIKPKDE